MAHTGDYTSRNSSNQFLSSSAAAPDVSEPNILIRNISFLFSLQQCNGVQSMENPALNVITNGFDKFAVVSDLSDHPSLKYRVSSQTTQSQNNGTERQSAAIAQHSERNGKPRASINEIASALSRKSSPSQQKNGFCSEKVFDFQPISPQSGLKSNLNGGNNAKTVSTLSRILESQAKALDLKQEQERQKHEIERIILAQAAATYPSVGGDTFVAEHDDNNGSPEFDDVGILDSSTPNNSIGNVKNTLNGEGAADSTDGGLGPSDEQVRASMIHLLNPVLGSAFGITNENKKIS
ncbi:hypothetical protein DICVIV_09945 [Dictyocaulus viviparus]|uniref:Uncharacterized protein n=1 Tax=Dictyocaulus viviparus TaxID=29172 RepID=A0A0D8XNT2_DICVI|nr:hypothetical protein DICVIV_09945 [Dictyocaulus viviparus]